MANEVISPNLQKEIQAYAESFLNQGRFDWDLPHTKSVVHYALELAREGNLDLLTMFTAAWFHDIGYHGLFEDGKQSSDLNKIQDRKAHHMVIGAEYARQFLSKENILPEYTEAQIQEICHLIAVHDNVEDVLTPNEIAIMEADTLGAIDISRVTPTFDFANYQKYKEGSLARRIVQFRSEKGREYLEQLLPAFYAHFEQKKN